MLSLKSEKKNGNAAFLLLFFFFSPTALEPRLFPPKNADLRRPSDVASATSRLFNLIKLWRFSPLSEILSRPIKKASSAEGYIFFVAMTGKIHPSKSRPGKKKKTGKEPVYFK